MVHKKGSQSGHCFSKLTKTEQEVLRYLTTEFLTPNKIAIRRGTTPRAVYKTINNLKKKGVLTKTFKKVHFSQPTCEPCELCKRYRLHGLELNIKLLSCSELYKKVKGKANHIFIDGNTIRLYNDSLEVYIAHSFFAESVQKATVDSCKYINRLLVRIENELKILIVKDRTHNIKLVNAHYSEINNGLAKECNVNKDKIKVYSEQGKLWFLIDNSFNLDEAETINPETSKKDMENVVAPFFNDLRDNEAVTMSMIKKSLFSLARNVQTLAKENKETATGLNNVVELLKMQLRPVNEVDDGMQKRIPDYVG